jgi:hypothetical protein
MATRQRGEVATPHARWAAMKVQDALAERPHGGKSVRLTNGQVAALAAAATTRLGRRPLGTLVIRLGGSYAPENSKPDAVARAAENADSLAATALFSWPVSRQSNADIFEFVTEGPEVIDLFAEPCDADVSGSSSKAWVRPSGSSVENAHVAVGSKRPRAAATSSQPANSKRLKKSEVVLLLSRSHSLVLSFSRSLVLEFSSSRVLEFFLCLCFWDRSPSLPLCLSVSLSLCLDTPGSQIDVYVLTAATSTGHVELGPRCRVTERKG